MLLNPRRTRTNMKLLQLVWIFLLTLCGQSAVINIHVKEDDDAFLDCSFGDKDIEKKAFDWTKDEDKKKTDVFLYSEGDTVPGPQFKGRVFHFPDLLRFGNASIKITKAKTSDSGTYTCYRASFPPELLSTISLTVGASPRPIVTANKTNNGELLKCEVLGSSPEPVVEWWDSDGKILPADEPQTKPQPGNKYDVILTITVIKAGFYRCVATQKEIFHQIETETHVNFPGGASEPSVTILGGTKDGVLLQCIIRGASPELQVFWKDKSGNLVPSKEPQKTETGGGYDIILQTTVTKTDYYRCVTTEGKKDDEVYSETHVVVPGETPNNSISGVVGIVIGLIGIVAAVVVGVAVHCFHVHKNRAGGSTPTPVTSSSKEEIL